MNQNQLLKMRTDMWATKEPCGEVELEFLAGEDYWFSDL